jgi:hypothetical protein
MIELTTLLIYVLAGYRITRFIIEDALPETIRNKIWNRFPPSHGVGYLITCYWCSGFWVATLLTIGYILIPSVLFFICLALAISAGIGIISKYLDRD